TQRPNSSVQVAFQQLENRPTRKTPREGINKRLQTPFWFLADLDLQSPQRKVQTSLCKQDNDINNVLANWIFWALDESNDSELSDTEDEEDTTEPPAFPQLKYIKDIKTAQLRWFGHAPEDVLRDERPRADLLINKASRRYLHHHNGKKESYSPNLVSIVFTGVASIRIKWYEDILRKQGKPNGDGEAMSSEWNKRDGPTPRQFGTRGEVKGAEADPAGDGQTIPLNIMISSFTIPELASPDHDRNRSFMVTTRH
ncbi:hypothetical protein C0J52_20442, partial [Blattella germanica]